MKPLARGSTIGILGGGQLGRMLAMAAAKLGYRCHIYAPDEGCVAADVAAQFTRAAFDDPQALAEFADCCDIITYEFENIPAAPLQKIAGTIGIIPGVAPLTTAQDRMAEKQFAVQCGGQTTAFLMAENWEEFRAGAAQIGFPAIAKTNRMGYDGKGQIKLEDNSDLAQAWDDLGQRPVIIEALVDFNAEFSVILVRGANGDIRYWDSARNLHKGGILAQSTVPAGPLVESQIAKARILAGAMADALDYVGVMTAEFFATKRGPIFNEMAPRVHNSGHWTIEGAVTSQFENHIRAICGLPLGDTATTAERVEMHNLIGKDADKMARYLSDPGAHVHIYGKSNIQPDRKMGHVTRLYR